MHDRLYESTKYAEVITILVIQVLDLEYLLDCFPEDNFTKKYRALNEALTGLITDYR